MTVAAIPASHLPNEDNEDDEGSDMIDLHSCGKSISGPTAKRQPPPRRAAYDHFKKATILRAEGGRLHAVLGRRAAVFALGSGSRCPGFCTTAPD